MSSKELVPIVIRQIGDSEVNAVNARELHAKLKNKQEFSTWIKAKIVKYDFVESVDWVFDKIVKNPETGGRPAIDYFITLGMAKELSMVENNEQGRVARKYFIECEAKVEALESKPDFDFDVMVRAARGAKLLAAEFNMTIETHAFAIATGVEKATGLNPLSFFGEIEKGTKSEKAEIHVMDDIKPKPKPEKWMIPTALGIELARMLKVEKVTAQEVNYLLDIEGLQTSRGAKHYPTMSGDNHCTLKPYENENGAFNQILWSASVLPILESSYKTQQLKLEAKQ